MKTVPRSDLYSSAAGAVFRAEVQVADETGGFWVVWDLNGNELGSIEDHGEQGWKHSNAWSGPGQGSFPSFEGALEARLTAIAQACGAQSDDLYWEGTGEPLLKLDPRDETFEVLYQAAEQAKAAYTAAAAKSREAEKALQEFECGVKIAVMDEIDLGDGPDFIEGECPCRHPAGHTGAHSASHDHDAVGAQRYIQELERYKTLTTQRSEAARARGDALDVAMASMCQAWDPRGFGNPCTRRKGHRGAHRRPDFPFEM